MAENIKFGLFTILCWALGLMLTGAVMWLELISPVHIQTAALFFFALPIVFLILLAVVGGISFSQESWTKIGGAAIILLAFMIIDAFVLNLLLNEPITEGSILQARPLVTALEAVLFVTILFAIYEETFFSAIAALFKKARSPDWLVILLSMVVFTFLHALRYPDTLFYSLFLSLSRAFLTGALLKVDNTDVSFMAHIGYNVFVVFFGS